MHISNIYEFKFGFSAEHKQSEIICQLYKLASRIIIADFF